MSELPLVHSQSELSRGELLNWVNVLLKSSYTKIEQLGTGAAYCQLLDLLHPGKVPQSKLNHKARNEYEFINNLKLLQQTLQKLGISKLIEIDKLAKCKYQDNLEMVQWFRQQFELHKPRLLDLRREDSSQQVQNTSKGPQHSVSSRSNIQNSQGSNRKNMEGGSFDQVLVELNRCPIEDDEVLVRTQRDLCFSKLKQIEFLVEGWDRKRPAKELAEAVRRILSQTAVRNEQIFEAQECLI